MRYLPIIVAFLCMGCAKVTMNTVCPTSSTGVSFALSGSTVGATALSMLGGIATKAGVMASPDAAAAPTTNASMTYEYLPIFGADAGSLTCTQPPPPPGIFAPGPPPQIVR